jgi:hypothetical protein
MSSNNTYQTAYFNLTDPSSKLITKKKEFENLFQLFLDRYRPYSSAGRSLSEPIFNIKDVMKLF